MRKILSFLLLCLPVLTALNAQEFNATIKVVVPNIQDTDPKIFQTMENQLTDFMNSTQWTDKEYAQEEKIELSIQFNIIEEISDQAFKADVYIQAIRPTYNSEYKTPLFTHLDKDVYIEYFPFMELNNSQTNFFNNLSSILSFYSYLVIGLDYDSFEPLAGDPYFLTCKNLASAIPQGMIDQDPGWRSIKATRNRFILMQDLINPRMRQYREEIYNYHRHSLDKMYDNVVSSQEVMVNAIQTIGEVNRNTPNSMLLQVFANTKRDEIVEILKAAQSTEKTAVYQVMSKIDPANVSKYRLIRS